MKLFFMFNRRSRIPGMSDNVYNIRPDTGYKNGRISRPSLPLHGNAPFVGQYGPLGEDRVGHVALSVVQLRRISLFAS